MSYESINIQIRTIRIFRIGFDRCISVGFKPLCRCRKWNNHTIVCNSILCFDVFYWLHFGKKDVIENEINDIGFRWHFTTYLLYNGVKIVSYYVGLLNTGSLKAIGFTALFWGIGLLIHFVFFVIAQRNSIKGYDKDEIFN